MLCSSLMVCQLCACIYQRFRRSSSFSCTAWRKSRTQPPCRRWHHAEKDERPQWRAWPAPRCLQPPWSQIYRRLWRWAEWGQSLYLLVDLSGLFISKHEAHLPNKAPTANPAVWGCEKAAMALKMSGAPLPRARNVTPSAKNSSQEKLTSQYEKQNYQSTG